MQIYIPKKVRIADCPNVIGNSTSDTSTFTKIIRINRQFIKNMDETKHTDTHVVSLFDNDSTTNRLLLNDIKQNMYYDLLLTKI